MSERASPALRALLDSTVDYAGLFPPSGLGMLAAVERYRVYRQADESWLLHRFIVPASRLDEFAAAALTGADPEPWPLSVVISAEPEAALAAVAEFADRHPTGVRWESAELTAAGPERISRLARQIPKGVASFFEVDLRPNPAAALDAIAEAGSCAKIRTGGVAAEAIPSLSQVADFLREAYRRQIAFKATAGLHHPLRDEYPLTYEPASPLAVMHGFLNLALAAALLERARVEGDELEEVLCGGRSDFVIEGAEARWRDRRVTDAELTASRRLFFQSFGSCSFEEPVQDLKELGLL